MTKFRQLVVASFFLLVTVAGLDCPYKECKCSWTDILCNDLDLVSMPQLTTQENIFFTTLFLDRNPVTIIQEGSIPANLTLLSLVDTSLTNITYTAFNKVTDTLESLSISNASFLEIPDAFLYLNALKNLHITDSSIQGWNDNAMIHLGLTIEKLTLKNVGLTTWPLWLNNFTQVTDLDLSRSEISFIPDGALDAMAGTLTSFVIVNSALTSVPNAFSNLHNLHILDLDNNNISNVAWLPKSQNLTFLSLRNNTISNATQLSSALSFYGDSLYNLHIKQNILSSFPDLDFLNHVVQLDLSENHISNTSSGSLPPGLYELNLELNHLPSIPQVVLDFKMDNTIILNSNAINSVQGINIPIFITSLQLSYNLVAELNNTSFPQNSKLIFLYLNNNPLTTISNLAFQNLQYLSKLDLQYTKLSRLPLALSSLISINVFLYYWHP